MENLQYSVVQTKNGQIGYVTLGSGRPLIMINRYAATLYNWDSLLIRALAQKFTLYLLDSRLVGQSQSANADDIYGCIADIHDAIEALKLVKPILLGWSFGGVVVQQFYKAYPGNISGLVLLSSFADPKYASEEFIELSMGTAGALSDENKAKLYKLMVSETPCDSVPNRLRQNVLTIADYNYRYTNEAKELHNKFVLSSPASTTDDLVRISVPCLILNAKNDLSFPSTSRDLFIQNLPLSKLIVYPSGGHLLIHHHGAEAAMDITNYFDTQTDSNSNKERTTTLTNSKLGVK